MNVPVDPMTRTQRWTLAVVCAATAMLMLDIAVVNTALSAIADAGVAALGALIPAGAAFGDGAPQAYVDGFHDALWVGAGVAVAAAVVTAVLLRQRRDVPVAGDVALDTA